MNEWHALLHTFSLLLTWENSDSQTWCSKMWPKTGIFCFIFETRPTLRPSQMFSRPRRDWDCPKHASRPRLRDRDNIPVYHIPVEKGIMSSLPTTSPFLSRNLSGRNCSGSSQTFGSMCTLYRFAITYKTFQHLYSVSKKLELYCIFTLLWLI